MPRPIFKKKENNNLKIDINFNLERNNKEKLNNMEHSRKILRKQRTEEYIKVMLNLDIGNHFDNDEIVMSILEKIKEEFPELSRASFPEVIITSCYLGHPYEVHAIDFDMNIIEHYKKGQTLDMKRTQARNLIIGGKYVMVEIYSDCIRAVDKNGMISVVNL